MHFCCKASSVQGKHPKTEHTNERMLFQFKVLRANRRAVRSGLDTTGARMIPSCAKMRPRWLEGALKVPLRYLEGNLEVLCRYLENTKKAQWRYLAGTLKVPYRCLRGTLEIP